MREKLTARFEQALLYAFRLHAKQMRKSSNVPYISHLLGVTALVIEDGGDEDEAIAALLHDAVEDQGGKDTREEIRQRFGEHVAAIVDGCSDTDVAPKPPWRERKEAYIMSLADASPQVIRVSTADKLHNARSILQAYRQRGESVWERFKGGKEGTLWYYAQVVQVLEARGGGPMAEELGRVVDELEHLVRRG